MEDATALGLIPARAGKTPAPTPEAPAQPAHPRAGGENIGVSSVAASPLGSSPRGRGKPRDAVQAFRIFRLIPARAGKTRTSGRPYCSPWAHPRAGGENISCHESDTLAGGSSPRGRGKQWRARTWQPSDRLIPARAGKTFGLEEDSALVDGSSPRGRGKPLIAAGVPLPVGLIPARAGKTSSPQATTTATWAHPRAGGENVNAVGEQLGPAGSSPRGRGKLRDRRRSRRHPGLIPARAGKTGGWRAVGHGGAAHPRAGGENWRICR